MPNIADHFNMPDAEQAGDKAEGNATARYRAMIAEQADAGPGASLAPLGYQLDRTYSMFNAIQQLDQVHRTLNHLQLPSIAAILNEAITALGTQWLDERKP